MIPREHVLILPVRFGDCDPAGIAYFPVLFDWFHQAMEDWFDRGLASPYRGWIGERRIGFPAVHSEADFSAPCVMGDTVAVRLRVTAVGAHSLTLGIRVTGVEASDQRATGHTVVAVTDLAVMRSVVVPVDLRDAIAAWQSGS